MKQILVGIKPVLLRGFNHAEDDRAALCAAGRVGEQKVLPVNDKWFDASLCTVVADFQPAVFKICSQVWPLLLQIVDRFAKCGLWCSVPALCPSPKGVQNRLCPLLTLVISFFRTALLQFVLNGKQLIAVCPSLVNL